MYNNVDVNESFFIFINTFVNLHNTLIPLQPTRTNYKEKFRDLHGSKILFFAPSTKIIVFIKYKKTNPNELNENTLSIVTPVHAEKDIPVYDDELPLTH